MATANSLPSLNSDRLPSPPELDESSLKENFSHFSATISVEVTSAKLNAEIYTEKIVHRDHKDKERSVLFLHGASFTSQNWLEIRSLYHVASWGWKAVAIDLPDFGKSNGKFSSDYNAEFIQSLITALGLTKPVIVSPSMSGRFSLPFLFGDKVKGEERATGYVPVAPVHTAQFLKNYPKSQLPTLIVTGSNDLGLGSTSNQHFSSLPRGQYAVIQGARHACYMNDPDTFHRYLYHFLSELE